MNDDRTTRAQRKKDRRVRKLARLVMKSKDTPLPPLPEPTEDYLLAEKPVGDVEPLPLEWLWPGRIPLGALTLIAGDEGVGKSLVALDIAARVTCGSPWPDTPDQPQDEANVLILSAYDPLLGTAMPRFVQAGNNLERTFYSDGLDGRVPVSETGLKRRFRLPADLRRLRHTIDEHNPMRLVVIDPIWAFCAGAGRRDATDPAILAALAKLAAEYEVAIVCVTGMKRATRGRAAFQAAGDKGLLAAARAAWGIVRHPGKEGQRALLPIKMNLGPEREGLEFRIGDGRIEWDRGPTKLTATAVIAAERSASGRDGAEQWLRTYLSQGSRPAREILEQALECGMSRWMLQCAKSVVGIKGMALTEMRTGAGLSKIKKKKPADMKLRKPSASDQLLRAIPREFVEGAARDGAASSAGHFSVPSKNSRGFCEEAGEGYWHLHNRSFVAPRIQRISVPMNQSTPKGFHSHSPE